MGDGGNGAAGPTLRPGRPGDAPALTALALRSKAHWGYDEEFLAACREELTLRPAEVEPRRTIVAERDGRPLGFSTLEGEPPGDAELGLFFVEPAAMGRGLGRALFTRLLLDAGALGFERVAFDADPYAEPFYRAMGAARVGGSPSGSIPGRVLPRMAIPVPPRGRSRG
ncbi:GNAT family N-acetyltransferase [Streptomyces alkaliphilus]|uniref:GNAT family N-acetyltransferase n=1 Tax=Streptomyces alkaliphilus TaxID=1472722 RepID=A0A7W3TAT2_9ACTN|nr:GNAT family N-acetyltransferase [Streptomyces alkaliphilus]MBB0243367.1 GNAT family N-acetyltransferase [Streptomyces alkaliphilus]